MQPYHKLALIVVINIAVMFALTYALVAEPGHIYPNLNRLYMALFMAAPMQIIMLLAMPGMYPDKRLNYGIMAIFAVVFFGVFGLMRSQGLIGDKQFLRSMIPHHSSAIVMCEQSAISDAETSELCGEIVQTQLEEIRQMEEILHRLNR